MCLFVFASGLLSCLLGCLFVCSLFWLFDCLVVGWLVCLPVCLFGCPSVCLLVCLCDCLSGLLVYVVVCLPALSVCLLGWFVRVLFSWVLCCLVCCLFVSLIVWLCVFLVGCLHCCCLCVFLWILLARSLAGWLACFACFALPWIALHCLVLRCFAVLCLLAYSCVLLFVGIVFVCADCSCMLLLFVLVCLPLCCWFVWPVGWLAAWFVVLLLIPPLPSPIPRVHCGLVQIDSKSLSPYVPAALLDCLTNQCHFSCTAMLLELASVSW